MRTGGFTVQQALSAEAASVIKQAVQLARRRGHAQVTPLHVASIMLYSTTGLLRTACLESQSHSHPLQCKALELCFNVALNRLPASSSTGILGGPQHHSISNALVAAFKRAQAHQRRGSIENQQQPLLAVKIEIQQLMVSILDDPSVSRVMREAGFSSTLVKTKLEENVSLELCSQSPAGSSINDKSSSSKENNSRLSVLSSQSSSPMLGQERACKQIRVDDQVKNEDVMGVIEELMDKRTKSLVIVGEEVATVEGVVKGVMDKVNQGDVPDALKQVKFISLPLFSFNNNSRGEVEQKLEELNRCMKTFVDKGVVLYLGDLKWITDYRASNSGGRNYYCSVEHMIVELGRLGYGLGEGGRFWLMGIGSFQTYMKCKTGHPNSIEGIWGLHPHTIPAANLGLSLITDSYVQDKDRGSKKAGSNLVVIEGSEEITQLTCCADCSANFKNTSSTLPSWLKDENKSLNGSDDQENVWIKDLCKKWNSFCRSSHKQCHQPYEKTVAFSSSTISPSSSASLFYSDQQNPNFNPGSEKPWPAFESNMGMYIPENIGRLSNPSSAPNSTSSSDNMEMEYITKFKEFNTENLKTLCSALEKKVPLQQDVIAEIVGTILQCRSGMLRRKEKGRCFNKSPKEETWLFIQGIDKDAKETFARELAKVVFGPSHSNFMSISLCNFYSTRADSIEDSRNKRSRDEQSGTSFFERLTEAMSINPHRVFLIEDVEQADYCSQMDIKKAIEGGKIRINADGDEVSLGDCIIILSCESLSSWSRACSPPTKQRIDPTEQEKSVLESEETSSPCTSLNLNVSFEDDGVAADMFIDDDIGLVESVDRYIIFN